MSEIKTHARAVADVVDGLIVPPSKSPRPPERVFQALTTGEIIDWWVNPGVFDTREWSGDVRVGGRWRASGMRVGRPTRWRANSSRSIRRANWCRPGAAGHGRHRPTLTYLLEADRRRHAPDGASCRHCRARAASAT